MAHVADMSTMIQIRNVPDSLHRALKARAARAGMSLSDYLRSELETVVERLPASELRYRLAQLPPVAVKETSAKAIRRARDER